MARHLFLLSILLSVSWLAVCHAAEAESEKKPEQPSVPVVKPEKSKALTNALEKIRGTGAVGPQQFPLPYPVPFGFIPTGNIKTNVKQNYDGDSDGDGYDDDDDDGYDNDNDGYPANPGCTAPGMTGNNVNDVINLLSPPLLQPLWPVLLNLLKPQICGGVPGTDYPGTDYPGTDYGDGDDDGYDGDDDNYDNGDSYDNDNDGYDNDNDGYDNDGYGNKKKKTQAPVKKNGQKAPANSHKKNSSKKNPKKPESTKAAGHKKKSSSKKNSGKTKSILSAYEAAGPAPSSYPLLALLLHQQQEQARLQNELRMAKQKAYSQPKSK